MYSHYCFSAKLKSKAGETLSSLIQLVAIIYFHKKVFKMAPLHHHFEQLGWEESDIVKTFYVVGLLFAMAAITYGVWI